MKRLTKLISLILAFCMAMSLTSFAAYKDVDANADYADALSLLSTLGIFEGDEYGNFNPNKTITRAEMAAIVCRAMGLGDMVQGTTGHTEYADVPADHWASGYINIASQYGIINGYGNGSFGPSDTVTYEQAIKMIVCALGFEPMAAQKGGWPTGYLVVANTYKITNGVSAYDGALRSSLAMLMYNALSTPMMDRTTWGTDAEYQVLDGKGREYRTLLTDMDIYIATGTVGEKYYDDVYFNVTLDSDDGMFEEGKTMHFAINGTDIVDYKYKPVEAYVRETSRGKYEVVAVASAIDNTSLKIISDDIEDYVSGRVTYYTDPYTGSGTKTIRVVSNPDVEYNKGTYSGSVASLLLTEEDVELEFIENTGDSVYDVIVATKYVSARVKGVEPSKDKIIIGDKTVTLDFYSDATIILQDSEGNELDLNDFSEDDVVAVVADNTNYKNYVDYIKIIKLDNSIVRGSVDSVYTYSGKNYVTIDGEEFIDGTGNTLTVDDTGIFYIGMTGKIIEFDGSSAVEDYAYIMEAALATSDPFSSDKWQLKLLTANDGIVTYTLTDDANTYFESTYAAKLDIDTATQTKQLFASLTGSQKADTDRLITYKVNSRGYIKTFESANTLGTNIRTISASSDEYRENMQKINGAVLEDNAIVFNLTNSSADKAYTTDISYLVDEGKYSGFVFANSRYEYCVMVITSGESPFAEGNGISIVTRLASTNDSYGNPITKVTFVQNEEVRTVTFDDDSENKAGADGAYAGLKAGDVFTYNANSAGIVSEYVILGTVSNGLFVENTLAYDEFDEETEFIYGYIANSSPRYTSKGETLTVNNGVEDTVFVPSDANRYSYVDSGRNIVIETEDYMAEDAYYFDPDTGEATFVFIKLIDDTVTDIYSFNKRVVVDGSVKTELLINSIGTVGYDAATLAAIEAAEASYALLTASEKASVSNYSVLTAARATYDAFADNAAADAVEVLIDAIGTVDVTDACKDKIEEAEAAFTSLTLTQRELVDNYTILTTARAAYDALVNAAQADEAEELIAAIGTVDASDECKAKIEAAEAAYAQLSDEQKLLVENRDALASARETFNSLVNSASAENVDALIMSIGVVDTTNECKDKIEEAEDAYAALSPTQKDLVLNYGILTTAKASYNQLVTDETRLNNFRQFVAEIGTVDATTACKNRIESAEEAYIELNAIQKELVTSEYATLASVRAAYNKLVADIAGANEVIALISAIGKVDTTLACKNKIEAAETAYIALTAEQKTLVSNYAVLTAARASYEQLVVDTAKADEVKALISAIGKVELTTVCKTTIEAAENAYTALTAEQKTLVSNYSVLTTARKAYNQLEEDAVKSDEVKTLISAIGKVDISAACKTKIENAEKAYAALTAAQKTLVSNYTALTTARAEYDKLVAAEASKNTSATAETATDAASTAASAVPQDTGVTK